MVESDPTHPPASEFPDTWTVKEVVADLKTDIVGHLNKQDGMLVEIDRKVDGKADKADLVNLATEVRVGFDDHGKRITKLEEHRLDTEASKRFRTRAWAVAGTIGGILAIIAGSLIAAYVH